MCTNNYLSNTHKLVQMQVTNLLRKTGLAPWQTYYPAQLPDTYSMVCPKLGNELHQETQMTTIPSLSKSNL